MSLESAIANEFWSRLGKYTEFLLDQGVNLEKVRFTDNVNFLYDYEQNLISANPKIFYDGRVIDTKKSIKISCDTYDITNVDIAQVINNTELGIVVYVENLVKTYVKGEWVLKIQVAFLDEKMDILNDYDDSWNVNSTDETFKDKVSSIMTYFSENIADLSFMIIHPNMVDFVKSMDGFDVETTTYLGLPLKINPNLKEDIVGLCTYEETFYLLITNE